MDSEKSSIELSRNESYPYSFLTSALDPPPPNLEFSFTSYNGNSSLQPSSGDTDTSLKLRPAPEGYTSLGFFIVIGSLFFGTFLIALDTTIIGTAIPAITSTFHTLDDIGWYGSGYLLTLTALQPSFGKLYKLLSIKGIYLTCVAVFEVGSILCAAAPSSPVFIAGRAIAGCGAAGLLQGALVIITNTVPLQKRPLYLGVVISVFGICVGIGPVLGGTFSDHATWRWCFWINVPIGAVVMVLITVFLRLKSNNEKDHFSSTTLGQKIKQLDLAGTILIVASICSLLLAMQWGGQTLPWRSPEVIGLFVGSGLMFVLFLLVQWRMGDDATLPFSILRQRSIVSGAFYLLFFSMPTYVYGYYIPIYFQSIKGFSALKSGVEFLSLALPQIGFTVLSGGLASRFGYYTPYLILGTAIGMVGSGLITMLDMETHLATWVGYFILFAIGTGISINHPYTAVQAVLSEAEVPTGNAILQFTFQLGGSLSLCIAQTIFLNRLTAEVTQKLPKMSPKLVIAAGAYNLRALAQTPEALVLLREAYRDAIRDVFIFALVAGGLALLFSLGFEHRNVKAVAKDREAIQSESKEWLAV
ncbi:MFS general substrate transporter [Lindgomyces ingoldianus]|uniref:MFS general substrate transporter n=1 Tax=Lindgomyces ingoldianus TaxID=673940 RepID=A0ACB6RC83_9PLEO|nr:MFS general substrate transporter [Lindgomyces ingoldianus]KAF2475927.1 MFS general substrate transporter [Lindgomyces ingoldianus]